MIVAVSLCFYTHTSGQSQGHRDITRTIHTPSQSRKKQNHGQAKQGRTKTHRHHYRYRYPDPLTKKKPPKPADATPTHPRAKEKEAKQGDYIHTYVHTYVHTRSTYSINQSPTNQHRPAPRNSTLSPLTHPSSQPSTYYLILPYPSHTSHLTSPQPHKKTKNTLGASHRISPSPTYTYLVPFSPFSPAPKTPSLPAPIGLEIPRARSQIMFFYFMQSPCRT